MSARQLLQLFETRVARAGFVGDVVDLAAERIDFEHRLALRFRHDAHGEIERAAGRALFGRHGRFIGHSRHGCAAETGR